jgi:hypothetical protein
MVSEPPCCCCHYIIMMCGVDITKIYYVPNMLCIKSSTCIIVTQNNIAHLRQQCHNSKYVIFQERLLSSGEFCKLCYETTPVKSASANISFYTSNSKMPNFELSLVANEWYIVPIPTSCTINNNHLHDFMLPPWCRWDLHSFGILCRVK